MYLTSGQAAKRLHISLSTLKRWVSRSELTIEELRNHSGWRLFSEEDVEHLREFKRGLKRKGKQFQAQTLLPMVAETQQSKEMASHG